MSAMDTAQLDLMFTELRLPTFKAAWAELAERADADGWPAARLLAALAEQEIADRARRRFERQLAEAQLPPGKTLANFDFNVVPMVSKAHVNALVAGDRWLDQGANLILVGPPGPAKVTWGRRSAWRSSKTASGSYTRAPPIWCRNSRSRAANWHSRPLSARLHKYHLLILDDIAYVRKDQAETSVLFRADQLPIRGPLPARHRQPAVRRVGLDLPRTGHDAGGHRPARASGDHLRTQCRKLSPALRGADPTPPRAHRLPGHARQHQGPAPRQRLIEETSRNRRTTRDTSPFAILQRRHERPLPRPPPIRHHQPSRHLLILIVALFSSCLSRYRTAICGPRYAYQADRTASRAGTVASTVVLGGRRYRSAAPGSARGARRCRSRPSRRWPRPIHGGGAPSSSCGSA